ncbi:TPR repeat-containing protein [Desulfosudis oleivorans Hxd3]|uniref:TPR repeat-containing protein n=2 Tax=Desulfosudis TaxID=2904716 RepID=A8ZZA2_DESOH|nr:TPR repeat-containing protein [Desulfosudis oleivorans Hxd3]
MKIMPSATNRYFLPVFLVSLGLVFINLFVYFQILDFSMVYFEEEEAFIVFADGVTLNNIKKIFIDAATSKNWYQPIALASCMLDAEFLGSAFGPRHMVDLCLHIGSVLMIFLFFRMATGTVWPSAGLAGLFAVHPINVESVAWVGHHDAGLTLFFLSFCLVVYFYYVRSPSITRYLICFACFLLALFSHPRILTFPLLLMLLDFWPLSRINRRARKSQVLSNGQVSFTSTLHIREKFPFFCVSLLMVGLGGISELSTFSLSSESLFLEISLIPKILVSYGAYLWRIVLFTGVESNRYIMPYSISTWQVVASLMVLVAISICAFRLAKKGHFYFAVGWAWFLIAMAPGALANAATNSLFADRYAYLGAIGIFIIFVWGVPRMLEALGVAGTLKRITVIGLSCLVLAVLMHTARSQAGHWRDSLSLVRHTLAVVPPERISHESVGAVFLENNAIEEAVHHFSMALRSNPDSASVHVNISSALIRACQPERAIYHCKKALLIDPENSEAHHNFGNALLDLGDCDGAIIHFRRALELHSASYQTYNSMAVALLCKGDKKNAVAFLKKALAIYPAYETARKNLDRITGEY